MAKRRKRKKKTSEELNAENELMKLKMMAEFGGNFMGNGDIPPRMENQFLKQIISFHKLHDSSKVTTVYKFIGEPEYNHVHDLTDKEMAKELKRLIKLMEKNGVALSVLAETPKREIYRFITEELFKHEIEDVRVKGWINQFIYEEFYPNADYDVRSAVLFCIQTIFNKGSNFYDENFSEDMKDKIGLSLEVEELFDNIKDFQGQFTQLKSGEHDLSLVEIDNEAGTAHVICDVSYKAQAEKGRHFKTQEATIEFNLEKSKYADGWWEIKQIITDLF